MFVVFGLIWLIVFLFCFDTLHDEVIEHYMKLSKSTLNKLESKVGFLVDHPVAI